MFGAVRIIDVGTERIDEKDRGSRRRPHSPSAAPKRLRLALLPALYPIDAEIAKKPLLKMQKDAACPIDAMDALLRVDVQCEISRAPSRSECRMPGRIRLKISAAADLRDGRRNWFRLSVSQFLRILATPPSNELLLICGLRL